MASYNRVILIGNLTKDPELRYTPSGMAVTDLRMAVTESYTKNNERKEDTLFIDVTVWARQAETCCEFLSKGKSALIEGRLQQSSWEDKEGNKRSKISVVAQKVQFLSPRGEGGSGGGGGGGYQGQAGGAPAAGPTGPPSDDDIPF